MAGGGKEDLEGRHVTNFVSCTALSGNLMVRFGVRGSKLRPKLAHVENVERHRSKEPSCSSDLVVEIRLTL